MSVLTVDNLKVSFPGDHGTVRAVNGVTFSIGTEEKFGVVGESGSGKSVVGASIIRILPPKTQISGSITLLGKDLFSLSEPEIHVLRGNEFSFIPQNPAVTLNPLITCGWQIAEMFVEKGESKSVSWKKSMKILSNLLFPNPEENGLKYPHQFSGGMKQRVVTGISMTGRPRLLIADEPTKGLDKEACGTCREIFETISREHSASVLLITHDLDLAEYFCTKIGVMYAGELVEVCNTKDLFSNPHHPYTRGLLAARPKCGLIPLSGHSPDLMNLPKGCHFQDRCELCDDTCIDVHPEILEKNGRYVRCHHCS
nr:ABC transporter ATP-binding protein [uncultured Methanospirillum sp.]